MSIRKTPFVNGEFYHIYNRGVDKREIFMDDFDIQRFFQSMTEFNVLEPIGSIYENSFVDKQLGGGASKLERLVNFVAYCLNPNHYHFLLEQVADKGIEKFMHRMVISTLMLICSNVFMTFAWYGHLKYKNSPLWMVIPTNTSCIRVLT